MYGFVSERERMERFRPRVNLFLYASGKCKAVSPKGDGIRRLYLISDGGLGCKRPDSRFRVNDGVDSVNDGVDSGNVGGC